MKYINLVAGIVLGGTLGMLFLFTQGHIVVGAWVGGLVCGLSFPAFYEFIHKLATKEEA